MSLTGMSLLQAVSERVLLRWMERQGRVDVQSTNGFRSLGKAVDATYSWEGSRRRVKVKPDPYFGTDNALIADRALTYYRADSGAYAFEAVANTATREPGWIFDSEADDLYYYYVALSQTEDEVRALLGEPDEVFFSELAITRDELVVLPLRATREWFENNYEAYTPRPVMVGGASAWYRLVPRRDLERAVQGINMVGPVFRSLGR